MGTYARYCLWAGVLFKNLQEEDYEHPFIQRVLDQGETVRKKGLNFVEIGMHSEMIGIGVEIIDLNWVTVDDCPEEYDRKAISNTAGKTLDQVGKVLQSLGITATAKLYHHIDLGG